MIIVLNILFSVISCLSIGYCFKKIGIVDSPDGIKKIHKGNISYGGGLCIVLPLIFCFMVSSQPFEFLSYEQRVIIFTSFLILFLGLIDDIKPLVVSLRLITQVLASWLVILLTDIYIRDFGDLLGIGSLYVGEIGIPLTIFMVVGVTNAFNMLDGMDGLVSIVSFCSFICISLVSLINGKEVYLYFLFSVSVFIFLLFNLGLFRQEWKIFLGDSGSMWLGFLTAWLLIDLSQGDEALIYPASALWFVLLPLIDALSTFVSRIKEGKAIFSGDRNHIHHILQDRGLKKWKILLLFLLFTILSCGFAFYASITDIKEYFVFYGFLTLWFFYHLILKYPNRS